MVDTNLQHVLLAMLGVTGIEIIHDVHIQEWSKIFLQALIAVVTLYKLFKKRNNDNEE